MIRLTASEWQGIRPQMFLASAELSQRSQLVTFARKWKYSKYLPYAYTEQGVAMLSGILHSDRAIQMHIAIMRTFMEIRRLAFQDKDRQVTRNEGWQSGWPGLRGLPGSSR
jgi:hypothetical protein